MSGTRDKAPAVTSAWRTALNTAMAYALVAGVWIVGSDRLVAALPEALELRLQTMKGLLFVLVTAAVLFVLVLRLVERLLREAHHARSVEHILDQVVETVPVGVMLLSDEGLITFVNPSVEALLGLSAAQTIGHRLDELGVIEHHGAASLLDQLRTGAVDGLRIQTTEGGVSRALIARAAEVEGPTAGSEWVVAIADVTDAQEARDRSARLVQGYQYLSHAAIAMTRIGSRRALLDEVARLAVELGGFAGAWVLYRQGSATSVPETAFFGAGGQVCDEAEHIARAYGPDSERVGRLVQTEITVSNDLAHDPRDPWYSCAEPSGWGSAASLALDAPGGSAVVLVLFARTTGYFDADQVELLKSVRSSLAFAINRLALDRQRLDAEEALEKSERGYRTLFEIHPQPMWVYDLDSLRFLAVNDAAVKKYGYSRDEFLGMTIADIRPRDEVPRLLHNVLHVNEGLDDAGIWTHVDRHGREFPVHIYSHTTEWEGRHAEIVMVMEVARVE